MGKKGPEIEQEKQPNQAWWKNTQALMWDWKGTDELLIEI